MKKLSIVILNYNTKELLATCLETLKMVEDEVSFEVIVVDNGSTDGSFESTSKNFPWVKMVRLSENLGFAKGNNAAKNICMGEYVLFLNTDTVINKNTLKETAHFLDDNKDVGAVTCKIVLPNGQLDKDSRRTFPTPWVAFTHFSGLDKVFPKSRLFAKYWYGYLSENETHDVDVLQGAFCMVRKSILDQVGWYDEAYFLDGEDIDLCWKIKEKGYRIVYYPKVSILHIKGATKGKRLGLNKSLTPAERRRFVTAGIESMEIFYKKHLWEKYPYALNLFVLLGIKTMKFIRFFKV